MDYLSVELASSGSNASEAEQLLDELDRILPLASQPDSQAIQDTASSPSHERRRKHREGMARLRSERRACIQRLSTQASALHKRLRHAVAWMDRHRAQHEARDCRCLAYVELVTAAEALLQERYSLEDELAFRERYARLVRNDRLRLDEEETKRTTISTAHETNGYWVWYADDATPLFFTYETVDTCATAIQNGLRQVAAVRATLAQADAGIESSHCLGWHVEHLVSSTPGATGAMHSPELRYRFTRRVSRLRTTLPELEDRTWTMLRTPSLLAHMYGATVVANVVQTVSDDAFILFRNAPERSNHKRFRYFSLASRMRAANGTSVAVVKTMLHKVPRQVERRHGLTDDCTIDSSEPSSNPSATPTPTPTSVVWLRSGVSCFQFSAAVDGDDDDDSIGIEYVGFIRCVDDAHAQHLVTETCLSLLRWEQFVVPPRHMLMPTQ